MYKGLPEDQFHQFIASSRSSSIPRLPISLPHLHGSSNNNTTFSSFDPYSTPSSHHHHQQVPFQPNNNFLHQLHQVPPPPTGKSHREGKLENDNNNNMVRMNLEKINGRARMAMIHEPDDHPWSSDEVLALLKIRSNMENWFPEFTWEHVSRKLADLGFKRSPEKCKERFEEESRYFNNISNDNFSKNNYRLFGELEELYNDGAENPRHQKEDAAEDNDKMDKPNDQEEKQEKEEEQEGDKAGQEESRNDNQEAEDNKAEEGDNVRENMDGDSKGRKRKRSSGKRRFEMFQGFCEGIVHQILHQQKEMLVRLLEDMVRRDEEKVAREEERRRQEMDRINEELELRAQEQALAGDRQATIIKFLEKFTSSSSGSSVEVPGGRRSQDPVDEVRPNSTIINVNPSINNVPSSAQNSNPTCQTSNNQSKQEAPALFTMALGHQSNTNESANPTSSLNHQSTIPKVPTTSQAPPNPNSPTTQNDPSEAHEKATSSSNDKLEDHGKRWPKDEVLALINLRCSTPLNNNDQDKEGAAKAPPRWERISKGMFELGYKRSAKRCKEKWENINKYFRKTKDLDKKRSAESRTCPYFHQLNALYNQGTLDTPTEGSKSCLESP